MKILRVCGAVAALAAGLFLSALSTSALAMNVRPILVDLTSGGADSRGTITVTNAYSTPLPVELTISELVLDENGQETLSDARDEFVVFPPQAIIAPGATQNFQLRWAGEPNLPRSRSFAAVVSQLPVALPEGQSGVQILYNFRVIVNVAPLAGAPQMSVVSAAAEMRENSSRLVLMVRNDGPRHGYLSETRVRVTAGGKSQVIEPSAIQQTVGIGLVQPGKQRRFEIPVDLPPGPVTVQLQSVAR